jgi:methionine sulfoxide reductase catalytic subunit
LPILGCEQSEKKADIVLKETLELPKIPNIKNNPQFTIVDRPITSEILAGQYNNFYEYGGTKSIWKKAQKLPTDNWKIEVTGLVKNPQIYDLETILKKFDLEERIYRLRCVEAWSMVIPWLGFPMQKIISEVEPKSAAKFVKFTSYYDPKITKGPDFHLGNLPWPYTEGLRIEEMANELAFFAVGVYGHLLPKQHGAPLRMVTPCKYGFKGAKSIVKIEFVAEQPATFWNTIDANEYDFEANVNPTKPHPRWSQATEKFIGTGTGLSWVKKETLPYNGYGEDLKLLLQELNITNAWVIGHSLGGTIALQSADIFPEVIQGVICVNAGGGLYLKDEFTKFVTAGEKIVKFRPRWFVNIPWFDLLFARANVVKPLDKSWGRQRIMDFVSADYNCALGSLLASTTEEEVTNLPQIMSRLKQPVYFIAGKQDDIMPVKFVRYLADFHYLENHVLELDKCGHLAMLEQPEAIANYIREIFSN